jgi:hypothetical protein
MSRIAVCCLAFTLVVGLVARTAAENPVKAPAIKTGVLTKPIEFKGQDADPNETLQDILDMLANRYDISFDVNEAAFKADNVEDVLQAKVMEKPLPAAKRTTIDALLKKVLARVPSSSGTTYLLRRDVIEITTASAAQTEIWGKDFDGPYLPLVHADFEKKPLAEALEELASASGFNIVIDARVAEKAKTAVTARLLNAPLDTAVRLLADMSDLKPFQTDNLLYVTTRENADRLEAQEREKANNGGEAARKGSAPPVRKPAAGV